MGADLHIIPVLNKIDLPGASPDKYAAELAGLVGCDPDEVLRVSAKTGEGASLACSTRSSGRCHLRSGTPTGRPAR